MKKLFKTGKIWTILSAFLFLAMCGLLVYASSNGGVFDSYKVDNLQDGVLNETQWNSLMDDLNEIVPEGAVVAFNRSTCPDGWNQYNIAEGRVIMGGSSSTVGTVESDYLSTSSSSGPGMVNLLYCIKGTVEAVQCPATTACSAAGNGDTCITYENNEPEGSACVPTTSICNNGQWSTSPKQYASCTSYCVASGACGRTASGDTCITYASAIALGSACTSTTSVCDGGRWTTTPKAYSGCKVYCQAQGKCKQTAAGGPLCTTYRLAISDNCNNYKIESKCQINGTWDNTPGSFDYCVTNTSSSSSSSAGESGVQCGYASDGNGNYAWVDDLSGEQRGYLNGWCQIFPTAVTWKCRANRYCEHYNVTCSVDGNRCRANNSNFSSYCCCTVGVDTNCIP